MVSPRITDGDDVEFPGNTGSGSLQRCGDLFGHCHLDSRRDDAGSIACQCGRRQHRHEAAVAGRRPRDETAAAVGSLHTCRVHPWLAVLVGHIIDQEACIEIIGAIQKQIRDVGVDFKIRTYFQSAFPW